MAYQGTKFQTILLFPWIWLLPQDWFPITNMIELSLCYEEWTSHFIRGYLTTGFYSLPPRLQEGYSWLFGFCLSFLLPTMAHLVWKNQAQDELFQLRAKCAAIEAQRPPRVPSPTRWMGWSMVLCKWRSYSHTQVFCKSSLIQTFWFGGKHQHLKKKIHLKMVIGSGSRSLSDDQRTRIESLACYSTVSFQKEKLKCCFGR